LVIPLFKRSIRLSSLLEPREGFNLDGEGDVEAGELVALEDKEERS
jgi:hypothetical protein